MTDHDRELVVLGHTNADRRLLRAAGQSALGRDAELILLTIMPSKEFEERDRARLAIPHLDLPYSVGAAEEEGKRHANELAAETLGDLDVSYEAVSAVGREASIILDTAAEYGCSQIFLAGHRNNPWQHTTFDKVMTEIITKFDGPVTVMVEPRLD